MLQRTTSAAIIAMLEVYCTDGVRGSLFDILCCCWLLMLLLKDGGGVRVPVDAAVASPVCCCCYYCCHCGYTVSVASTAVADVGVDVTVAAG